MFPCFSEINAIVPQNPLEGLICAINQFLYPKLFHKCLYLNENTDFISTFCFQEVRILGLEGLEILRKCKDTGFTVIDNRTLGDILMDRILFQARDSVRLASRIAIPAADKTMSEDEVGMIKYRRRQCKQARF